MGRTVTGGIIFRPSRKTKGKLKVEPWRARAIRKAYADGMTITEISRAQRVSQLKVEIALGLQRSPLSIDPQGASLLLLAARAR